MSIHHPIVDNPLLEVWSAPFGLPPFDRIRAEHFEPAFERAMREQRAELDALAAQDEAPSFDNTIAAFDASGRLLARLDGVFHNLCASETSPDLQAVQRRLAQPLAAHNNAVYMHVGLFARVDALYEQRSSLGLDGESLRLLERVHLDFVRAGARLKGQAQQRYAQVMETLADLHTRFGQNVLADESTYTLPLCTEADLAGLPASVRDAASDAARVRGLQGHVITLSRSLIVPFLTFSERRDLREQAWRAWTSRGEQEGQTDNRSIVREILKLRAEQAVLHGQRCYADYALQDTMAGRQSAVMELLTNVWQRALPALETERAQLASLKAAMGQSGPIEAWDWRYWAEKVRNRTYAIDDSQVKPYFSLDRMVQAAFDCARRLFGVHFRHRPDLVVYHPDVKGYEVLRADGTPVGLFLHDNFARPTKRSGAWMSAYRLQSGLPDAAEGRSLSRTLPIIVNNNNFAKAPDGQPTLLSFDDVRTLFHEFGHGLHGLLSDVRYERLSGTQVLRDFVELPSQLFEHWMSQPQVLQEHARHVVTGEPIPLDLIDKLQAARNFGQGYETVRYTASALTDMAVHALGVDELPADVVAFEADVLKRHGLPPGVGLNHRYTHFQHLFSGSSYAAGYYVYLWAAVLDCDAFEAFEEAGDIFDAGTALRLLQCIYSSGNRVEPGQTYRNFRGRDARVEPMLRDRGLIPEKA
ncbi:MAG: M3 family peptidase [Betaproteobacteria bacterium]|nr:M3 family peptidase [Betaproteobacteria bacterium]